MRPRAVGVPRAAIGIAVIAAVAMAVPVVALLARVDPGRLPELLTSDSALTALRLSLLTTSVATVICVLAGVPLALVLARCSFPGKAFARGLVLLPLVLPPVVAGVAVLSAIGRRGLLGATLEAWGVELAFSTAAVIIAQVFVAMPFLVLSVEGALRGDDGGDDVAAATLGASPAQVFWRVTLPRLAPALAAGTVLVFARALGEFGATITAAGSLQGVTRTLPLEIYLQRETDPDGAVALSALLLAVAVVVIVVTYGRQRTGPWRRRPGPDPASVEWAAPRPGAALSVRAVVPERGVDVELDIAAGETVAVVGPNGAGKSTLLSVVAGVVHARGCAVSVGGEAVETAPPHRRGVALLTQRGHLFGHLTALDNVAFSLRGPDRRARARGVLRRLGAETWRRRYADQLSGGQAARVAVARALAAQPQVVLLDEPLAALDVASAIDVRAALAELLEPCTVLLVTHDAADLSALADRVVVLEEGQIVDEGSVPDVLTRGRTTYVTHLGSSGSY
ncbi:molybdate ABC transporter permease subunit [Aeromicrobium phragmitis]|uniref:Molybdate ABC transporter permease subunit n=1 Tax=Aeromicrobium phragmitis TaxID=2478914 RepID=A0A3L8PNG5_9ACTN|nr:ABC transporter permease [Aeromicrobium phragmitis]RLV56966.1 molybdate ABC transporter permease subunit [Aeromicrobium phragmitis]